MSLVEVSLPSPAQLRGGWAAMAAVCVSRGWTDSVWAEGQAWFFHDGGGNWATLRFVGDGRAVLIGHDHEYTETYFRDAAKYLQEPETDLLVVLDVERILDEETIMKTPRRTRKRRRVELIEHESKKKVEKPKIEESAEQDNCAPDEPEAKSAPVKKAPAAAPKAPPAPAAAEDPAPAESKQEAPAPAAAGFVPEPSADAEGLALQAVEVYAAKIDTDPVLSDLFKSVGDPEMLDLLMALFNAAYGVSPSPSLEQAYMSMINQPGLADDHFMSAGTAMHSTLTELNTSPQDTDRIMQVIDEVRIKVLDS